MADAQTLTLAGFLLARIAEDEAVARAVLGEHEMYDWDSYMSSAGWYDSPAHVFAQRNDPARVLAECEAKQQVVESYQGLWEAAKQLSRAGQEDQANVARNMYAGIKIVLGVLALPYADHPDYREEFRP